MSIAVPTGLHHSFVETIAISADAANVALPAYCKGWYLTQAHIKTSADNAVTISILKGSGGATIGTLTTTAGTTGEFIPLASGGAENRYITATPYYTLSGMGSGTATLELVFVK